MNIEWTNPSLLFILLGVIAAIMGSGLAIFGIFTQLKGRKNISTRMAQFVASEEKSLKNPVTRQIIPREISGSLFSRTIVSWLNKFLFFLERLTPKKMASDLEHKLEVAGNPAKIHASNFFAIRFLMLVGGIFLALLINLNFKTISAISVGLGIMVIGAGLFLPIVWLNGRVRSRQDGIRRELPNVLDMLSVCADAGLAFDQSLQKISLYWDTDLGHELVRVTQELEMGVPRAEALKNMSNRLDVDELSRFIAIIVQAEMIGMSFADVLHAQAVQMRVLRQYWAREIANKLPAKMILPLALCIFPALIAVILGPIVPSLLNAF